jgi:Arc/MetJ-type ribon-helix-helix transcriptional regulator
MKERISVTIEKDIVSMLNSLVKDRKYRNRSHAVEMAVEQLKKIEDENSKK